MSIEFKISRLQHQSRWFKAWVLIICTFCLSNSYGQDKTYPQCWNEFITEFKYSSQFSDYPPGYDLNCNEDNEIQKMISTLQLALKSSFLGKPGEFFSFVQSVVERDGISAVSMTHGQMTQKIMAFKNTYQLSIKNSLATIIYDNKPILNELKLDESSAAFIETKNLEFNPNFHDMGYEINANLTRYEKNLVDIKNKTQCISSFNKFELASENFKWNNSCRCTRERYKGRLGKIMESLLRNKDEIKKINAQFSLLKQKISEYVYAIGDLGKAINSLDPYDFPKMLWNLSVKRVDLLNVINDASLDRNINVCEQIHYDPLGQYNFKIPKENVENRPNLFIDKLCLNDSDETCDCGDFWNAEITKPILNPAPIKNTIKKKKKKKKTTNSFDVDQF